MLNSEGRNRKEFPERDCLGLAGVVKRLQGSHPQFPIEHAPKEKLMADFGVNNGNSHRNNASRVPGQPNPAFPIHISPYFKRAGASDGDWLV